MQRLRQLLFDHAAAEADRIVDGIDADGKVWLDGTWGIMNQDTVLPIAVLAHAQVPENPRFGEAKLVDAVHRIAKGTFDLQDHLGRVEFVKPDGSRWGWTHLCWTMYGLLEAYRLITADVPELRRQYWQGRLLLVYNEIAAQFNRGFQVHNIPAWHAMALNLAGYAMGRSDFQKLGEKFVRQTVAAQLEDGYWIEGTGPTTLYQLVYTHALGVYEQVSGDPGVVPALRRAGAFADLMQWPDATLIAVTDGRVRYHDTKPLFGLPGMVQSEAGRRYLSRWLASDQPFRCEANGWTALGSAMLHLPAEVTLDQAEPTTGTLPGRRGRVVAMGRWQVALSAFTGQAPPANRWLQDRAQHLGVFHREAGVVVEGGNCKQDMALAQARWKIGEAEGHQFADTAELLDDPPGPAAVVCRYPEGNVTWSAEAGEAGELTITCAAAGEGSCTASLQLWCNPGDTVTIGDEVVTLGEEPVARYTTSLRLGNGVRLAFGTQTAFLWPLNTFNPYTEDGSANLAEAVATVSFPLEDGDTVAIVLACD